MDNEAQFCGPNEDKILTPDTSTTPDWKMVGAKNCEEGI